MNSLSTNRVGTGLVGVLLIGMAGGCQSYAPQPLALSEHRSAFLARTPESLELSSFAESLRADADAPLAASFDLKDGASLAESEVVALVFNPELRIARLSAGVAQAGAENAGLWADPVLGVDLTRVIQSVENPWKLMASVGVSIPVSGRLEVEKKRAGRGHAAELAKVAEVEWRLRMDLRREWARWTSLSAKVEASREFLARVDNVLAVVDAVERAGEMPRLEARLFRIERDTRRTQAMIQESEAEESRLALLRLMGLSPAASITLLPELTGADPEALSEGASAVEKTNPRVLVAAAEYEAAEAALELAVREQYPDIGVAPGYGREDGNDEVLLGFTIPLPVLNGNRRAIAEARAERDVARARAAAAVERALADLELARARLSAAERQRGLIERELLPQAEAQYADLRRAVEIGEARSYVLIESLTQQQEAREQLIDVLERQAMAAIALEEVIGPREVPVGPAAGGEGGAP